ncbi:MAG: TIGR03862 family flavoprotein [Verrucomicrobiota bacterium]|nr:TIGR03862 family flavoprotein [Verrucomicrobiota bacterium]
MDKFLTVVGAGPAGLRAAEVATSKGARVLICDAQGSAGRKFLVAGRGGLNLTHSEPVENFPARYRAEPERWRDLLAEFGPEALRTWAEELSVETYVGTSQRVFPRGQKAAVLLRAWLQRLRTSGVEFKTGARLSRLTREGNLWRLEFADGSQRTAGAVVLAMGGASWPDTGSDGTWPSILAAHGVEMVPFAAANCGWNVRWPRAVLEHAEGLPLKNLNVTAAGETVSGELLITRYGLEGGAIYRLGPLLRGMAEPELRIDFKPQVAAEVLRERAAQLRAPNEWFKVWKLSPGAIALLQSFFPDDCSDPSKAITRLKDFPIPLESPRPIAEAISTAGGVRWHELDDQLMLRKMPRVFLAGEMIDWEAPTGGYLLQGCFSTGTRAGRAAARITAP